MFEEYDYLPESCEDNQIFNGGTYLKPLLRGIVGAKHSVVISSPRLYRVASSKLVSLLKEQNANGIEVSIFAAKNDDQSEFLKSLGFHISIKVDVKLCAAIIDKSTVWYGSVNVLGYNSEEDNIVKLIDEKLAIEMLDVLYD